MHTQVRIWKRKEKAKYNALNVDRFIHTPEYARENKPTTYTHIYFFM